MSAANKQRSGRKPRPAEPAPRRWWRACQAAASTSRAITHGAQGGIDDGDTWPGTALACAFAYVATGQSKYLAPALLYWKAALGDDQNLGEARLHAGQFDVQLERPGTGAGPHRRS
jgi:hypothetical protein